MFKVFIAGGDEVGDYDYFKEKCIYYLKDKAKSGEGIMILSTGDDFPNIFAERYGIAIQEFYPDWNKYKNKALSKRNESIFDKADAMIIFYNDNIIEHRILKNEAMRKKVPMRIAPLKKEG